MAGTLCGEGGHRAVQVLEGAVDRPQHGHQGEDRIPQRLGERLAVLPGGAWRSRSSSWTAGLRPQ